MFPVLRKKKIAADTFEMSIGCPDIARAWKPGQFVIVCQNESGERIPLTIVDGNRKSIRIVFQAVGASTARLALLKAGMPLADVVGPLGNPVHMDEFGALVMAGGGVGCAALYPVAMEAKEKGNRVIMLMGFKTKDRVFFEREFSGLVDKVVVCTDDGSYGSQCMVSDLVHRLMKNQRFDRVFTVGPVQMMKAVAKETYQRVSTIAGLNPIMLDGIGMCGGCRVMVEGSPKFACVDGPHFDAHKINFDLLLTRNRMYLDEEQACQHHAARRSSGRKSACRTAAKRKGKRKA